MVSTKTLIPLNLKQQEHQFLDDPNFNPQFEYPRSFTEDELTWYGVPSKQLLDLSNTILEKAYFNATETDLYQLEGRLLSQEEVNREIRNYIKKYEKYLKMRIHWSDTYLVRTSVTSNMINLKLPCKFQSLGLRSMLYHEIGTHALRRINYSLQPFYRQKKKCGMINHLKTEEGLATINGLIPQKSKSAFRESIRYLAVSVAQRGSFLDVWNALKPYVDDHNRRWMIAVRSKRGLTDTSRPGGFTKDILYFEGLVSVWKWLCTNNSNATQLYWGKIAMEDVEKAVSLNPNYSPILPDFMIDQNYYQSEVHKIGTENFLDKLNF